MNNFFYHLKNPKKNLYMVYEHNLIITTALYCT